jgi:maltose/moltooligosaccharide transporter
MPMLMEAFIIHSKPEAIHSAEAFVIRMSAEEASRAPASESFRAFVAHLLPEEQPAQDFAIQSLFIGLGAVVASALPWTTNGFHVELAQGASHAIPHTVKLSFYSEAS